MRLIEFVHRKIFAIFRRRRMKTFYKLFPLNETTRLLDIGGAPNTWLDESGTDESVDWAPFAVTMVNLRYPDPAARRDWRFTPVEGDATALPFADASFDIAFSNSVIEHMTTWERQQAFAAEARRVAGRLWIQTPARSFPLEPHLLAPFFQYWPRGLQRRLARNFTLWGLMVRPDDARVEEMLCDIRLLTLREMKELFPDCTILKERMLGLTKSYIAVRGVERNA
jgi:hypothetical protein